MNPVQVQLGNTKLRVPVVEDETITREIAATVSARLKQLEEEAGRIDTQAFALRAAFDFAAEIHVLRSEKDLEDRELALSLDRLLSRLQELRQEYQDLLK